jgi:hypothetical protein
LIISDPNSRLTIHIHHNHECEKYQTVSFGNGSLRELIKFARGKYYRTYRKNVNRITTTFRQEENEGIESIEIISRRVLFQKNCLLGSFVFKRRNKVYS